MRKEGPFSEGFSGGESAGVLMEYGTALFLKRALDYQEC